MSANATLTNLNATESIQSTTNPIPTGDLVTSSISEETFTSDVIARQQESTDTCLIEYPLWRSGDNCMDKQLTENVLFGLSIGKSIILYFVNSAPTWYQSTQFWGGAPSFHRRAFGSEWWTIDGSLKVQGNQEISFCWFFSLSISGGSQRLPSWTLQKPKMALI